MIIATIGRIRLLTSELTSIANATPITNATASSTMFPRNRKSRSSFSILPSFGSGRRDCGRRRGAILSRRSVLVSRRRQRPRTATSSVARVVTIEDLATVPLFAALGEGARERLARVAADISLLAGEYAAHEGEERALFAVLDGRIEPTKLTDGIARVVGVRNPGDLFGEVPITLGTVFPVGFRAAESSRVMRIEAHDYHAISSVEPELAKEVGRLARHRMGGESGLQGIAETPPPPRAIVVGHRWDASCTELRRFLDRNQITFRWVTPDAPDAQEQWEGPLPTADCLPAIRVVDGKTVVRPQFRRIAALLGLAPHAAAAAYDVVIVGARPAGLPHGVYGASEGLSTIVVEREAPGGQAGTSSRIENYLGFPNAV